VQHGDLFRSPMTMSTEEAYLQLLDLMYHVANSLKGIRAPNHRIRDCNLLGLKLFYHATTVYWLRQGTQAPVPIPDGSLFYDFGSVAVIARAALETYLTMFELFFEAITGDELEFRHAYWQLSGFVVREDYTLDSIHQSRVAQSKREIQEMRCRIKRTATYASLTPRLKRRCLAGKMPGTHIKKRLEAAGLPPQLTGTLYRYLSGYTHSDGLSGVQLMQAKTKEDQLRFIDTNMDMLMMTMAKMILEYKRLFPSAQAWCLEKPEASLLAEAWSDIAAYLE